MAAEEGQGGQRGASQAPAGLVLPEGLRMEVLINTSHVSALSSSSSSLRSHTAGRFRCQPAGVCRILIRRDGIFRSRGGSSVFFCCFQPKSQTGSDLSNGETILFSSLLSFSLFWRPHKSSLWIRPNPDPVVAGSINKCWLVEWRCLEGVFCGGPRDPHGPAENLNLRFSQRLIRLKVQASFLTVDLSFLSPPWKRALLRGRAGRGGEGGLQSSQAEKAKTKQLCLKVAAAR